MDIQTESDREKRSSVIVRAMVTAPGGESVERRVRNLSRSGACIEHHGELTNGMVVALHMGTIDDLDGRVMWVTDRLAGLQFSQAVDLDQARKPRGVGTAPRTGWMAQINDAYRR